MHYLQTNFSVHDINTRYKNELHIPLVRLSAIQRGITYYAIKVFIKLPLSMSRLKNDKQFFKFRELSSYTWFLFYRRVYIKLLVPFL
jgi:hypothetical protein